MVARPSSVNILGIVYQIEYVDKPSDVDIFKRKTLWGQIGFWTRTIRVYDRGNRPIEDVWQMIFHEVLHGIADALNQNLCAKMRGKGRIMASRETHDLFHPIGRRVVWRGVKKHGRPTSGWWVMLEDTFMPIVCWFAGHGEHVTDPDAPSDESVACRRCHRWL